MLRFLGSSRAIFKNRKAKRSQRTLREIPDWLDYFDLSVTSVFSCSYGLKWIARSVDIARERHRGRPANQGSQQVSLAKRAVQVRRWQAVKCTKYGETVVKLSETFRATNPPIERMLRVVQVDEDDVSIGAAQHGFSASADGWLV
jgi:hypothetical protein